MNANDSSSSLLTVSAYSVQKNSMSSLPLTATLAERSHQYAWLLLPRATVTLAKRLFLVLVFTPSSSCARTTRLLAGSMSRAPFASLASPVAVPGSSPPHAATRPKSAIHVGFHENMAMLLGPDGGLGN